MYKMNFEEAKKVAQSWSLDDENRTAESVVIRGREEGEFEVASDCSKKEDIVVRFYKGQEIG